jgi:hypothetical protein
MNRTGNIACVGLLVVALVATGQAPARAQMKIPVEGVLREGGALAGTFTLQRFVAEGGRILASGILEGTLRGTPSGNKEFSQAFQTPVNIAQATCQILRLDLAALSLDILGFNARISAISLVVDAQSGPGRLIGNILCAIANLPTPNLAAIADLLNQILRVPGALQVR